jgi:hypothetical protein
MKRILPLLLASLLLGCDNNVAPPEPPLDAFNGGARAHLDGAFAPLQNWPVIAVHAILLPNGKVMTFSTVDGDGTSRLRPPNDNVNIGTKVDLWDPFTNTHTDISLPTELKHNMFCSGHTVLSSGDLLVSGGHAGGDNLGVRYYGTRTTYLFDFRTNKWTRASDMAGARWYPSVVTLSSGDVLSLSGLSDVENDIFNRLPEVWQAGTKTWRALSKAVTTEAAGFKVPSFDHLYPMLYVAPDGSVLNVGGGTDMRSLDTSGDGQWSAPTKREDTFRYEGSSALLENGQILVVGGNTSSLGYGLFGSSTNTTILVDIASKTVSPAPSMNFKRTYHNATILPNAKILVNGGNESGQNFDVSTSVYQTEIFDPQTKQWSVAAEATAPRNYHSTAVLLPDGRVLTAGGGMCGACDGRTDINQFNAEIYYPPYLFKRDGSGVLAERPKITSAPVVVTYGANISVAVSSSSAIDTVRLIRTSSSTHATNFDQRSAKLEFSDNNGQLSVKIPADRNRLPPGTYLLFVLNGEGVPSVARVLSVQ